MVDYATRPASLSGCWSSWSERDMTSVVRTTMETGIVKVRRRTTGLHRTADVTVVLPRSSYVTFMYWFRTLCQSGVMPTNMYEPTGIESIWRFMEPPEIDWSAPSAAAFQASCAIERLPGWEELSDGT